MVSDLATVAGLRRLVWLGCCHFQSSACYCSLMLCCRSCGHWLVCHLEDRWDGQQAILNWRRWWVWMCIAFLLLAGAYVSFQAASALGWASFQHYLRITAPISFSFIKGYSHSNLFARYSGQFILVSNSAARLSVLQNFTSLVACSQQQIQSVYCSDLLLLVQDQDSKALSLRNSCSYCSLKSAYWLN